MFCPKQEKKATRGIVCRTIPSSCLSSSYRTRAAEQRIEHWSTLLIDIPWFILDFSSAASSVMFEDCDSDLTQVRIVCPSFSMFPKIFKILLEMCQSFDQELFQSNRIHYKNERFSRTPLSIQFHFSTDTTDRYENLFFAIAPFWNARVPEADRMFHRGKSMWFSLVLQQCVDLSWSRLCREVSWEGSCLQ